MITSCTFVLVTTKVLKPLIQFHEISFTLVIITFLTDYFILYINLLCMYALYSSIVVLIYLHT